MRNAVAAHFSNQGVDRFLFSTLRLDGTDVAWLCSGALKKKRARRLLLQLLDEASDRSILAVQRDEATRESIFESLLGDPTLGAKQIARLLTIGELRIEPFLEIGHRLLSLLKPEDSEGLATLLLERALAEAELGDKRVPMLVAQAGSRIDPRQLVRMAVVMNASPGRVGDNVAIFEAAPVNVRRSIIGQIDDLSDRLTHRRRGNLGEAAYIAWAAMIAEAGTIDRDAQLRAAVPTLAFALRLVKLPVSALIVATFPIAYAQLLKSEGYEGINPVPTLLTAPFSFFADWDREKAMRRDLVDAFLRSSWPPTDLLLAAVDAGVEQKILERLRRNYSGEQFITAIEQDGQRLKGTKRKRVQEALSRFRRNRTSDDGD